MNDWRDNPLWHRYLDRSRRLQTCLDHVKETTGEENEKAWEVYLQAIEDERQSWVEFARSLITSSD